MKTFEERFWEKVAKSDGCWEWTASKNKFGYGQIKKRQYVVVSAHRTAYELTKGPIPEGMDIDHTCRNRGCVNPAHLRATTTKQNCENYAGPQVNNRHSGVRGVFPSGNGKWRAQVGHNGKYYSGGTHATIQQAEAAVIELRNRLFTHNDADRQQQAS